MCKCRKCKSEKCVCHECEEKKKCPYTYTDDCRWERLKGMKSGEYKKKKMKRPTERRREVQR